MNSVTKLSLGTIVQWDPEQITTEVAGEVLAMSIRQGVYIGMDPVASKVWKCLDTAQTIASLCERLSHEYQGDPEVIAKDLLELMSELHAFGLVTARAQGSAAAA